MPITTKREFLAASKKKNSLRQSKHSSSTSRIIFPFLNISQTFPHQHHVVTKNANTTIKCRTINKKKKKKTQCTCFQRKPISCHIHTCIYLKRNFHAIYLHLRGNSTSYIYFGKHSCAIFKRVYIGKALDHLFNIYTFY